MRREVRIVLSLCLISAVCWYSWARGPEVYPWLGTFLAHPNIYSGKEVVIWHEAKSIRVYEDGFELKQFGSILRIHGLPEDLKPNEDVNVKGIFHKEGHLTLKNMHIHRGRRVKIVVSILPVLIVFGLFCREYRFDFRKMMFFRRS